MNLIMFTKEESEVFYELLNSELRCLVNEYDDDTGRIPGKRRMRTRPSLEIILKKWEATQPPVSGTVLVNLEDIHPCSLSLSQTERKVCRDVIGDGLKKMERDLADLPSGALANALTSKAAVAEKIYTKFCFV